MGSNKLQGLGFKDLALISSILAFAVVMLIILCLTEDMVHMLLFYWSMWMILLLQAVILMTLMPYHLGLT